MILRPPGDRQAVALDRVREDRPSADRRPRAPASASRMSPRSWPPRSGISAPTRPRTREQPLEPRRSSGSRPARRASRARPRRSRRRGLVELVRHLVDAPAQEIAALPRECLAQPPAVLELDDVPAGRLELRLELGALMPGTTRSRLCRFRSTIQSDVAEPPRLRLGERLPDVALVELGVAEQGDEAPAGAAPKCVST